MSGEPSLQMIERLLKVLDSFSTKKPVVTLGDIRESTALPATTVGRLVSALTAQGLLINLPNGVGLSPRFIRWAEIARAGSDLPRIAEPFLRRLRDLTGETVALSVPGTDGRYTVAAAIAQRSIALQVEIGRVLPLHAGSGGRVILAYSDRVSPKSLPALAANTITNPDQLRAALERVRAAGWTFAEGEREDGLNSVAAPVWGAGGDFVGALIVGGPSYRITNARAEEIAGQVVAIATELSEALGFTKPTT